MRLTKQTGHAIRILIDCAAADGALVKVADVAERLDITPQNVFKLVHILSRAGFLTAVRGRNGGVRLARPATEIRVGDVVRATEVTLVGVEGAEGAGRAGGIAPINSVLDDALEAFISVLDSHTLDDMAAGSPPRAVAGPKRPSRNRGATARQRRPGRNERTGQAVKS